MKKELIIVNDLQEINRLEEFVEEFGGQLGLSSDIIMEIRLALEEAVVNVINYAYPPSQKKEIRLYAYCQDSELTFLLTDTGKSFDPTLVEHTDISAAIEDRPIGGLGVFLIREIMNEVSYQRIGGENQLTLKKKISINNNS